MLDNVQLNTKVGYFFSQRQDAYVLTEKQFGPLGARKTKAAQ